MNGNTRRSNNNDDRKVPNEIFKGLGDFLQSKKVRNGCFPLFIGSMSGAPSFD